MKYFLITQNNRNCRLLITVRETNKFHYPFDLIDEVKGSDELLNYDSLSE